MKSAVVALCAIVSLGIGLHLYQQAHEQPVLRIEIPLTTTVVTTEPEPTSTTIDPCASERQAFNEADQEWKDVIYYSDAISDQYQQGVDEAEETQKEAYKALISCEGG